MSVVGFSGYIISDFSFGHEFAVLHCLILALEQSSHTQSKQ